MEEDRSWGSFTRVALVAAVWVAGARLLAEHGWRVVPLSLLRCMTLQSYLTVMQIVAAVLGVGLGVLLLKNPQTDLAWQRPRWLTLGGTVLLAPLAYVLAVTLAVSLALPMLKAELLARGLRQVEESTGQFGRELRLAPVWLVLLWGVVISPVAEELVFRGPVWSAVQRFIRSLSSKADSGGKELTEEEGLPSALLQESPVLKVFRGVYRWLSGGGVATIVSAGVFGALHMGVPGALGFIRVASAVGLGLACGQARHATGTVLGPIALHVVFNLLAVGNSRRWFVVEGWLKFRGVPWPVIYLATACLVVFLGVVLVRRLTRLPD